jgi:hypothetical protein
VYQLTIDDHGLDVMTLHPTRDAACESLDTYLGLARYECQPLQSEAARVHYQLVTRPHHPQSPMIVGRAVIEPYTDMAIRRDTRIAMSAIVGSTKTRRR